MDKDNEKDERKKNIVLIHDSAKDEVMLNEEEQFLMDKLTFIEERIVSLEKIRDTIEKENKDSIFTSDVFENMVSVLAITAASEVIAEFFGLPKDKVNELF